MGPRTGATGMSDAQKAAIRVRPKGGQVGRKEVPAEGEAQPQRPRISISREDLDEGRYHRLELIPWWDQARLSGARVLIAGAGALGNEALKNLALLGVGHLYVCDLDEIETSNLTRSVLFRASDVGRLKAEIAAERVRELNPECEIRWSAGDLVHDLGLGVYRRLDVVLGCLDNAEARFALNRAAYRMGVPYLDAALDTLNGDLRVFPSDGEGPCYECSAGKALREEARRRQSCLKLSQKDLYKGHVPTAPTISSIIAGLQVQVAVRLLHGMEIPQGRRIGHYGLSDLFFDLRLGRSDDCYVHSYCDRIDPDRVVELPLGADATLSELLAEVGQAFGEAAVVDLDGDRDLIHGLSCAGCGTTEQRMGIVGAMSEDEARCPS